MYLHNLTRLLLDLKGVRSTCMLFFFFGEWSNRSNYILQNVDMKAAIELIDFAKSDACCYVKICK